MSMPSLSFANEGWKVIAETTSCAEKIQILGKEGEKFVLAVAGDEKTKLFANDGSAYKESSMKMTEYKSSGENDVTYRFIQPSYVDGNLPKIDVTYNGEKKRCKMELTPQ